MSQGKHILVADSHPFSIPETAKKHVAWAAVTLMAMAAQRLTRSQKSG